MLRLSLLSLFFLALLGPGWAQGAVRDPLRSVPELNRKVRIHAEGVPVGELVQSLSRKIGVPLAVSPDLAHEKVLVFGPDRPAVGVLSDLAALLNASWHRLPKDSGYQLEQGLPQKQCEAQLAQAETARMLLQLEEQVRALGESPEQLARRPERDRTRGALENLPEGRTATQLYAILPPALRVQLFRDGFIRIPYDQLSPAQQELARKAADPQQQDAEVTRAEVELYGLRFYVERQGGRAFATARVGNTGYLPLGPLDDPSQWSQGSLNPYADRQVQTEPPVGPEQVRATARERSWVDQLRKLAEVSRVPIVADYFRGKPVRTPRTSLPEGAPEGAPAEYPARELDLLALRQNRCWWVPPASHTLVLRQRDFYLQRQFEPPDRWVVATASALNQRNGAVTLADLLRLEELTPNQVAGLNNLSRAHPVDARFTRELHPLLDVLKGSTYPRTMRLYPEDVAVTDDGDKLKAATLAFPSLSAGQAAALRRLEAMLEDPILPEVRTGKLSIVAFQTEPPKGEAGTYRAVRACLGWQLQLQVTARRSRGQAGLRQELFLPLSLPDDRRERTVVEVVAPTAPN